MNIKSHMRRQFAKNCECVCIGMQMVRQDNPPSSSIADNQRCTWQLEAGQHINTYTTNMWLQGVWARQGNAKGFPISCWYYSLVCTRHILSSAYGRFHSSVGQHTRHVAVYLGKQLCSVHVSQFFHCMPYKFYFSLFVCYFIAQHAQSFFQFYCDCLWSLRLPLFSLVICVVFKQFSMLKRQRCIRLIKSSSATSILPITSFLLFLMPVVYFDLHFYFLYMLYYIFVVRFPHSATHSQLIVKTQLRLATL